MAKEKKGSSEVNVVPLFKHYFQLSGQLDEFKKIMMTLGSLPLRPLEMTHEKRDKIENRPKLTSTMFIISST